MLGTGTGEVFVGSLLPAVGSPAARVFGGEEQEVTTTTTTFLHGTADHDKWTRGSLGVKRGRS